MHLSLVEQNLRNKNIQHLSYDQKFKRNEALDILHSYWRNGVFPKNLYHKNRTPYFIDDFNTACAVGELIIKTGHNDIVQKIHRENNYGYIDDLVLDYPEIEIWAEQYGFEIDELAWIQPCYCFNAIPPGVVNVNCNGGYDGSYKPDFSNYGIEGVFQVSAYVWYNNEWEYLWCGGCDLPAGDYKGEAIDTAGNVYEQFVTIYEPDLLEGSMEATNETGSCDGTATANPYGGVSPYSYLWYDDGQTSKTATGLCPGVYTVEMTDINGCLIIDSVEVSFVSAIPEVEDFDFSLFPNPVNDELLVQLDELNATNVQLQIFNSVGQKVFVQEIQSAQTELNLSSLEKGIYFISIGNEKQQIIKRVIKN